MADKIYMQTRGVPALCRSPRLRAEGFRPSEVRGISALEVRAGEAPGYGGTPIWSYIPGNNPSHAVRVDIGLWTPRKTYFNRSYNPRTHRYELHLCWWRGARWECAYDETDEEPGKGFGWQRVGTYEELEAEIVPSRNIIYVYRGYGITFRVRVMLHGEDVSAFVPLKYEWHMELFPEGCAGNAEEWNAGNALAGAEVSPSGDVMGVNQYNEPNPPSGIAMTACGIWVDGGANGETLRTLRATISEPLQDVNGETIQDANGDVIYADGMIKVEK
ncbi:MAG: hypothetical protein NC204_05780 [Candidatus Amulumruptor caecigallinarius]|nr:hypothetical protein [Candidatus Amulumruptor caecigallinarius]